MNHWNNFVLGQSYIRSAARLCPKTREYVFPTKSEPLRPLRFPVLSGSHDFSKGLIYRYIYIQGEEIAKVEV